MKKLLIVLFLASCNVKIPVTETQPSKPINQDATIPKPVVPEPLPVAPPKPLTLKEKLSTAAKEFEKLETSYLPFCSKTPKDLNLFYTTLFYEMVRHESGFKNEEAYYECAKAKCYYSAGCFTDPVRGFCRITSSTFDGGFAVSRGLFQLSVSSVRALGCKDYIQNSQDLHNEDKNIKCAATIMKNYIISDKIITGKDGDKWRGLSRYWAVLRPTFDGAERKSYTSILKAVQKVEGCN